MLEGIATVSIYASDLTEAERWYAALLGVEAYFHVPGYVEFRIGVDQQELGIIDARYAPPQGASAGGAIVYWQVADLEGVVERLLEAGATEFQPVTDRGHGFRTASVVDPFGNVLGVMTNPHWVQLHEVR